MKLKHLLLLLAKWTGLFALSRRATSGRLRILAYHGINTTSPPFGNFLFMSAEKFADRMALLSKWGYPVIPLDDAWPPTAEKPWPPGATVITIDDGWQSTYQYMAPILRRHGFPATIFLTTYYCVNQLPVAEVALSYALSTADRDTRLEVPDYAFGPFILSDDANRALAKNAAKLKLKEIHSEQTRQNFVQQVYQAVGLDFSSIERNRNFHLMSPTEVQESTNSNLTFEMHTHRHAIAHTGKLTLREELTENAQLIEEFTGRRPKHFCFPDGLVDERADEALREFNVLSATTTSMGTVRPDSSDYSLSRIMDGENISSLEFEAELSGFMQLVRELLFPLKPKQFSTAKLPLDGAL